MLVTGNDAIFEELNNWYLGFVIIKPITDKNGNPLIGRTILKTYPASIENDNRIFLTGQHTASLYGIPLQIESLPFQTQDVAVGACATTALWTSLHPLNSLFGVQKQSPYEVTEISVSFPALDRNFPSEGLTFFQIKSYFNALGLETEVINIERRTDDIVADATRAYLNIKLPLIAVLRMIMEGNEKPDYHAVVISGYRYNQTILKKLYVHDDGIGPYSRVMPDTDFTKWKNAWTEHGEYKDIFVEKLVVPIYPKIRLTFGLRPFEWTVS